MDTTGTKASSLVFLQYLTTVFDNIEDTILLIGVEPHKRYRLLLANEAFGRNSGHTKDAIGKDVADVVEPESYAILLRLYQKVVQTKRPVECTEWFEVPLGRQAFEMKLIPILNTVGECVQIAAITRNVTELYELHGTVARLREQLKRAKKSQA